MRRIVAIALLVVACSAFGHEGEDHGAPPAPITQSLAPRATAVSDEFEIVATLEGSKLVVYLDRFATNEPVTHAKLEVEGAGLKGIARESAPGTYVMDIAAPLSAARHPLTFTIEAGESADLLSATLDTSLPKPVEAPAHGWSTSIVWIGAGLLLLGVGGLLAARRRRKFKGI